MNRILGSTNAREALAASFFGISSRNEWRLISRSTKLRLRRSPAFQADLSGSIFDNRAQFVVRMLTSEIITSGALTL